MLFVSEDNWILLEYEGGERFHSHCTGEDKRTIVMITCKSGETTVLSVVHTLCKKRHCFGLL